jgi:HSP20 family protein
MSDQDQSDQDQSDPQPADRAPDERERTHSRGDNGDRTERWFGNLVRPRFFPELWRSMPDEDLLRVEEFVDGDTAVVRAEMPGVDPERDIEITVADHQLRIRGERRQESKTENKNGYRSEFRYGSFLRTIALPAGASDQDVEATYVDGVLEVRVPVNRAEAAAKKIPVSRG